MRLDHLDFMDICRDERCERADLHPPHRVRGHSISSVVRVPVRRLLVDLTLEAVSARVPKTAAQIYTDVLDEYGSITTRNVNVALAELRTMREIAFIVPAGSQHAVRTDGVRGAYIRYDSPLLWQPDGLRDLMDIVQEMTGESDQRRYTRTLRRTKCAMRLDEVSCGYGN